MICHIGRLAVPILERIGIPGSITTPTSLQSLKYLYFESRTCVEKPNSSSSRGDEAQIIEAVAAWSRYLSLVTSAATNITTRSAIRIDLPFPGTEC
jgi:hypothetical protein